MNDTYKTIANLSEGFYKEKGSKFLAFAYPVTSENQVQDLLLAIKKKYHDARHHCYAYSLGTSGIRIRANDDGEPSSTAGKPILGQIQSFEITDVLIVVVRYFGGVLLGTGGLITAYREAAKDCLQQAQIITKEITTKLLLVFKYEQMNVVMRLIKEFDLKIEHQEFIADCTMIISVRNGKLAIVSAALEKLCETGMLIKYEAHIP